MMTIVSYTQSSFFFQAEDGIRDGHVTGVQTCALPIFPHPARRDPAQREAGEAALRLRPAGGTREDRDRAPVLRPDGIPAAVGRHAPAVGCVTPRARSPNLGCTPPYYS